MVKHDGKLGLFVPAKEREVRGRIVGWWEPPAEAAIDFTLSPEDAEKAMAALRGAGPPFFTTLSDGRKLEFLPPQKEVSSDATSDVPSETGLRCAKEAGGASTEVSGDADVQAKEATEVG